MIRAALPGVATVVEKTSHDSRTVFSASDAALVKSGTATLEAALAGTPTAAVYKLSPPASALRRLFRFHLPFATPPNILAGRFAIPEFLLEDATAENLSTALKRILHDESRRTRMRETFSRVRESLARGGSRRAAQAALELAR